MTARLSYERADNMWAAAGRPDGDLSVETVTLVNGVKRVFATDWKHEKQRNDGTNYYGSHGRKLKNTGDVTIDVRLTGVRDPATPQHLFLPDWVAAGEVIRLKPGVAVSMKNDIMEVFHPPKS